MMGMMLGFIPNPGPPLLGTTGTELLLFGLLVAIATFRLQGEGRDPVRFLLPAFIGVSMFYLLCPEQSAFQVWAGDALMHAMATLQAGLMRIGGTPAEVDGVAVVGGINFALARGCMGLSYLAMTILCLAVYPDFTARRLAGLAVLAVGMVWLNAFRLITLYHLWELGETGIYDFVHRAGGGVFALICAGLFFAALHARPRIVAPAPAAADPAPAAANS